MKFNEMPYSRPDTQKLKIQISEITEDFKKADSPEKQLQLLKTLEALSNGFSTQANICYIRNSVDTRDKFYARIVFACSG